MGKTRGAVESYVTTDHDGNELVRYVSCDSILQQYLVRVASFAEERSAAKSKSRGAAKDPKKVLVFFKLAPTDQSTSQSEERSESKKLIRAREPEEIGKRFSQGKR